MTDEAARRFRVIGRVQGVGFRWWTSREAERRGIRGTVRNCADGSVEVYAAGHPDDIESFAERLGEGPRSAAVEGVEGERVDPAGIPAGFRIIH